MQAAPLLNSGLHDPEDLSGGRFDFPAGMGAKQLLAHRRFRRDNGHRGSRVGDLRSPSNWR